MKGERWTDQHDLSVNIEKSNSWPPEHQEGALSSELRERRASKVI